jgi:hypothetical protein
MAPLNYQAQIGYWTFCEIFIYMKDNVVSDGQADPHLICIYQQYFIHSFSWNVELDQKD